MHLEPRVSPWGWPDGLVHNFRVLQTSFLWTRLNKLLRESTRTPFKRQKCYSPTSRQARVLVVQASVVGFLQDSPSSFFSYDLLNSRKRRIHTDKLRTRATFTCPQPRIPFFCSWVAGFTSNPSCLKYWLLRPLFCKEAMCKGSTRNRLLYAAKAVPLKDYFMHPTLTIARKRRWVISADYHLSHPRHFCAFGDVVAQKYDALCDWLWDACHMAGVRWISRCKGFRSRPTLSLWAKCKEAVIRQATINQFTSLDIPLVIPYLGCTA